MIRRRAVVLFLALALSAAGVGRTVTAYEHCTDAASVAAMEHAEHHSHHQHAGDAGEHSGDAAAHQHDDANGQAPEKCAKCCGVCVAAPTINVNAPSQPIAPVASTISFPTYMVAVGHILLLDPGIPKRS